MKKRVRSKKERVRKKNVLLELNSNYQRGAPGTPEGLADEFQEVARAMFPGAICRFDRRQRNLVIWVGDASINCAGVKYRGFPIVAVMLESELPERAPSDTSAFKYIARTIKEALPESVSGHEENAAKLFNMASCQSDTRTTGKSRTVPTIYQVQTCLRPPFKLEVRCSTTEDCARFNIAKIQFCGTPIKAIYDDKLCQNLIQEKRNNEVE